MYVHNEEQAAHVVMELYRMEADRPLRKQPASATVPTRPLSSILNPQTLSSSSSSCSLAPSSFSSTTVSSCSSDSSVTAAVPASSSSSVAVGSGSGSGALWIPVEFLQLPSPPPQLSFLLALPMVTVGIALDLLHSFHYRLRDIVNANPQQLAEASEAISLTRAQKIYDVFRRSLSSASFPLSSAIASVSHSSSARSSLTFQQHHT